MSISLAWNEGFPNGYGHTSIAYLRRCHGFWDAKNGELSAARFVVNRCAKPDRLRELREQYPNAVLLPVLGQNKLPLALAQAIGLPICYSVHIFHIVSRKFLCAIQRFLHKPVFMGSIQKDVDYILVDDVITQGGTIAALREFVMVQGGRVVAVVALAYAIGSHAIAPKKGHVVLLLVKFGRNIIVLLQMLRVVTEVQELTNSQVKYLLRFASIRNIVKKLRHVIYNRAV